MELTKEQIETIENRLQQNGLSYWDIRIEILDHIVSEIENKLSKGEPYDSAIENSFYKLNLNGNLESLNKSRLLAINKIVKTQYFNKVKSFFKSIKNLILITTFLIAYSLVFVLLNKTIFLYVSAFLLFAPVITGAFLYFLFIFDVKYFYPVLSIRRNFSCFKGYTKNNLVSSYNCEYSF